ncbi:LOW QUALITY PROTEIN: voltage-dependent calcium channel subunit alpha-2/delta-1-like [Gadus macrocephalus]|uniref:LOW QUALITY PROTEIN: voltage-dependent calcium channel subunit alpha-2/delta-1-like n=1 Tax=Gadus macrocephalus TaxID=80720 RepID=UPI0028CB5945|nr:LOW QUALITY PROTEIN: voltage-dependent calcium channel subunit alpha-2/delta-1-like [Gadus macrocephalus]
MDTSTFSVSLLLLAAMGSFSVGEFPTEQMIKEWADQMQKDLISLTDAASGMDSLIESYHNHRDRFKVESNNPTNLVAKAAENIEKLLLTRSQALKRLASEAEKYQMEHEWRDDYTEDEIIYYNSKDGINQTNKRFVPDDFQDDPDFKRKVSYNHTAVHIPTDIYNGSTIVLNELNWTEALEDVFRKNKEEDPSLLWQVFGSATGLARFFPASPWMDSSKTQQKIDLYDVRRRPWYIQGAASPKDMLILVDASGSVSGLTLKLIRTSVSEMLETLSDDDYVNVVSFHETAKVAACFQNLVQANVRNKKILKVAVQAITAKGITNYRGGFEKAFEQLALMNASRANCNKIIMLFTDGGEEKATEIFNKYNSDKKVRIFTFSVGQHNYDKGPIQSMACENRGYYYEIPSIGAIRINTQLSPTPCLLSPTPCLLSPTPCLLSPTPCLLSPSPCLLSPTPCLLSPSPCLLSPTPCLLSPTPVSPLSYPCLLSPSPCLLSPSRVSSLLPRVSSLLPRVSSLLPRVSSLLPRGLLSPTPCLLSPSPCLLSPSRVSPQIGRFFGVMDPTLMLDLVNSSLYTFNKTFDYQSLCDPEKETRGAGPRSVYVPTIADMLNIGWWATAATWSIMQQMLVSLTFPNFMEAADVEEDLSDSMSKEGCITQQTQYFFESSELSFKGTVGCDNCSRIYHAEKLPRTNLVFIIADARHTCVQCEGSPLVQDEQPSTGPNPCFLARNPRYRKGPTNCFDDNTKEQDFGCGGAAALSPSLWTLVGVQMLLLWTMSGNRSPAHVPS